MDTETMDRLGHMDTKTVDILGHMHTETMDRLGHTDHTATQLSEKLYQAFLGFPRPETKKIINLM